MEPKYAEVEAEICICLSPCESVRDSTWTRSALSHRNLTSSITSRLSLNWSCQGTLILHPQVPETAAPCLGGLNYRKPLPPPAPVAVRHSLERPLRDHGWRSLKQLCLSAEAHSWCEGEWALVLDVEAKSPARLAVRRSLVLHPLDGAMDACVYRHHDCICTER